MKLKYVLLALAVIGVLALVSCQNGSENTDPAPGSGTAESEVESGLVDAGVYSDESGEWGPLVGLN